MSVNSAAAEEKIDSAIGFDFFFIAKAFAFRIIGHAVEHIDIFFRDIDMVEEIIMHKIPIALVVFFRKSDVFVHVEGYDVFKAELAGFVHGDKSFIYAERRRPCRKSEHERTVFFVVSDCVRDMVCCPFAHAFIVIFDNKFHYISHSIFGIRNFLPKFLTNILYSFLAVCLLTD